MGAVRRRVDQSIAFSIRYATRCERTDDYETICGSHEDEPNIVGCVGKRTRFYESLVKRSTRRDEA